MAMSEAKKMEVTTQIASYYFANFLIKFYGYIINRISFCKHYLVM